MDSVCERFEQRSNSAGIESMAVSWVVLVLAKLVLVTPTCAKQLVGSGYGDSAGNSEVQNAHLVATMFIDEWQN